MGNTFITLYIPVCGRSVEDRIMRLLSSGKRSDIIISFFHGEDLLLVGGIVICLDPVGSVFFE